MVDNLPCITRYQIENSNEVIYENGYRLGWENNNRYYVNNHLDIILRYHQPRPDVYRVVGFEVQPQSIDSSRFKFSSDSPVTFPAIVEMLTFSYISYELLYRSIIIPYDKLKSFAEFVQFSKKVNLFV